MTITTKYDIGDEVWTIYGNRVKEIVIDSIEIKTSLVFKERSNCKTLVKEHLITYKAKGNSFQEYDLFQTKEELLKSL